MDKEELFEKIKGILKEYTEAPEEQITREALLQGALGLSSLDVVNLVMEFEDTFGIEIPDESLMGFVTVGDIEEYLKKSCG